MEEESSGCNVEDNDDSLRSESVPHPVLPHLNRVFRFDYLAELLSECSFRLFFLSSLSSTGQSMGYFLLSLRSVSLGGWALYLSLFLLVLWFAGCYYEDANTFQQIQPMLMFKKYYKEAGKQALASGQACSLPHIVHSPAFKNKSIPKKTKSMHDHIYCNRLPFFSFTLSFTPYHTQIK